MSFSLVQNPVIDTDRSVNAYSVKTMVADLIKPNMSDEEKLIALFSFHKRVMHHNRLNNTEDNVADFDLVRLYNVYGGAFCTQNATIFRTLCAEVFGWNNTQGTAGSGIIRTTGNSGGHSSFQVRFNAGDKWHWVDPTIGAFVRTRGDRSIASLDEIVADPTLFTNARTEGRASTPYFLCTEGNNALADLGMTSSTFSDAPAYAYYDYDPAYVTGFAGNWSNNQWTYQPALFTMKKNLQKGETYQWLWDFLPGDYFNIQDLANGPTRDWALYPPRHICSAKDSADTVNWKYFKPYARDIKGQTYYRYAANGIHTFAPDLETSDPKDAPVVNTGVAFFVDDAASPAIKPNAAGTTAEIAWRIKLPYPLMSLSMDVDYAKVSGDSLALYLAPIFHNKKFSWDSLDQPIPTYAETLSALPFELLKNFTIGSGALHLDLRSTVDPLNRDTTFYGYVLKVVMRAGSNPGTVGLNRLKVDAIFQHNMSALPQLEPGVNNVTLTNDSADLSGEFLKLGFQWTDNGITRSDEHRVTTAPLTYAVTVNQSTVPKMLSMWLSNARDTGVGVEMPLTPAASDYIRAFPNPFKGFTRLLVTGFWLKNHSARLGIYDTRGRLIRHFDLTSNLFNQLTSSTSFDLTWDGHSSQGSPLPAGLYFARLTSGDRAYVRRLCLLK